MEAQYWQKKWDENQIGFHQQQVNKRLTRYWPELELASDSSVFVPLCGKSLDMLWLHQQGHSVLGVELSEIACRAFFEENDLAFEHSTQGSFSRFEGVRKNAGICLLAGNFFDLTPEQLAGCGAFYDRASLIAMSNKFRVQYAEHLGRILSPGSRGLLLTIDYDASKMQGPPFPVADELARSLLEVDCKMDELMYLSGPERVGNLANRGLETLDERVYRLERNDA